ncbi:GGDEF domain-containing protein [Aliiglaciecola sp. LCG003]|uniref:GGDEF domain-containing protein n=1 Tax=Aliiglaciecola sp. LCG003 TaxID=3053655 RepID=UPI00257385D9|nr:GGDEF domain-containing protein [Aliiglaciecola sp. LCG003]WJG08900.1 GGDEF domain-containing protein [Aliiglaciecola sp. LCG003]
MINHTSKPKRCAEEYIIMTLSGVSSLGILPFAILRLIQQDWAVALLDIFAVIAIGSLFGYVYITHNTKVPARLLAFLAMLIVFISVTLKGSGQLMWIYPALTAIFFLLPVNVAALLSGLVLVGLGLVLYDELTLFLTLEFYVSAIATLLFSYAFSDRMRKQQDQLAELATKDPLTGAGNRRAMEQKLLDTIAFQRREQGYPASLILMDLDNFKKVNDNFGHAKGDDILIAFVDTIEKRIRSTDKLYRFGGEEFVLIAENTPINEAIKLAESLRHAVESDGWLAEHEVTISVGTAKYNPHESAFEWLGRADRAMYQAKEQGRNNCCVA